MFMFHIFMRDGSKYCIIHEDQETPGSYNKAAHQVLKRLNVTWDVWRRTESGRLKSDTMSSRPTGTFVILKKNAEFPAFKGVAEWIREVNTRQDFAYMEKCPYSVPIGYIWPTPKPQPPSAFLKSLAFAAEPEARCETMGALAPLAVKAILQENENAECPISLEPLQSFPHVLVPECGHVCGPDAVALKKCPVCRAPCTWVSVATSVV